MNIKQCGYFAAYVLVTLLAFGGWSRAQQLPVIDVVVGNNFGHLPMFVGVEKGLFKKHGVDVRLKVVNIGSQMVTSMQKNEVQIGDMSVTTFLKARHGGDPFRVIGVIQSDATRSNADEPLAIVARKDSGIRTGNVEDLKGKRIALSKGQTSDEYLKMVLARRNMKYEDVQIVDIGNASQTELATLLKEGKADASVCWEPFNTMVLEQAPDSYVVVRGGGHLYARNAQKAPHQFLAAAAGPDQAHPQRSRHRRTRRLARLRNRFRSTERILIPSALDPVARRRAYAR